MKKAREERIKLLASFFNIVAAGSTVTGFVVPLVQSLYTNPTFEHLWSGFIALIVASVAIFAGQMLLGGLKDD